MLAMALRLYSLGTFAWSAQAVLARGFYAMQNSKTPVVITTCMVFFFTGLCAFLPRVAELENYGLALALSIAGTLNMLIFFRTLQKDAGGLNLHGLLKASLKITVAALAASGIALLFLHFFWQLPMEATQKTARLHGVLVTLLASGAALAVYVLACLLLRVDELKSIRDMFRRKKALEPATLKPKN